MFLKKYDNDNETINPWVLPGLLNDYKMNLRPQLKDYGLDNFIELVSEETDIPVKHIKGKRRNREIIIARHAFCYLSKKYTNLSLKDIGEFINRDHTTIIHSLKAVKNVMETDEVFKLTIESIEDKLPFVDKTIAYEIIGK